MSSYQRGGESLRVREVYSSVREYKRLRVGKRDLGGKPPSLYTRAPPSIYSYDVILFHLSTPLNYSTMRLLWSMFILGLSLLYYNVIVSLEYKYPSGFCFSFLHPNFTHHYFTSVTNTNITQSNS